MALNQTTLADELVALDLYDNEPGAIQAWADAFAAFWEGDGVTNGAQSNAFYVSPAATPAAKAAMIGAMPGLAVSGAAALQAGIAAFWGALVPPTAWPSTTVITPPPGVANLAAALQTTFDANRDGASSEEDSMSAIAATLYAASLGGTATWSQPLGPQPIT
ncbi:MAG: hypothetical protein A2Y61_00245 [Chloroflexi bacterium RBG_13_60_13]|nr:MAG: hypothetical protein A2Y61_00245 [Chloroflexi bacterium RBG_13_60_13]